MFASVTYALIFAYTVSTASYGVVFSEILHKVQFSSFRWGNEVFPLLNR